MDIDDGVEDMTFPAEDDRDSFVDPSICMHGFRLGDMVWGKVESHPWWPGHIFNEAFASISVRRTKRVGRVLVAFFGDRSYGWLDPAKLIPFEPHFTEKSRQTTSRTFVMAVEEAVDEASRRGALAVACRRNLQNFEPTSITGYFAVDVVGYEPGGIYSSKQLKKARDSFIPVELVSFVQQLARAPHDTDGINIEWIQSKAKLLSYRKAVFEEFDVTYAHEFGVQRIPPNSAGVLDQPDRFTPPGGRKRAVENISPSPVIHLSSSSDGEDSDDCSAALESDSDDYSAASELDSNDCSAASELDSVDCNAASELDLGGDREIEPTPTKRQRTEDISCRSSTNAKLLPDGFLDPLPPPKPSNVSPMLSCKRDEHVPCNDTEKCFFLKLLEDYNKPKWRKDDKWVRGVWEMIFRDFNNRFPNANVSKAQLQDRAYQMKKTYKLLKKLSETSRLRWDHTSNMLQGPENVWKALISKNKDAKQWYNKPWPYYSTCQRLFEGKSVVENQSSGLKDCKESATTPQPVKTTQQFDELQEIEEVSETHMHFRSDLDAPSFQISSQKKVRPTQVPSGSFTTPIGKPSSNSKFAGEFTGMRKGNHCREAERLHDEREFSIKACMEAFYKLDGFTREDILKVGRVFKIMENREMFLSICDDDKELWLRGEMDTF